MPKLKRYNLPNHAYFITTKTLNNVPLFANEDVAQLFLSTLFELKDRYQFQLFSFVIMPDHIHLLLVPSAAYTISALMQKIKGLFAKKYREYSGNPGSVWQKSFYDFVIYSEEKLIEKTLYIHQNPVRRGLVADEKDYKFSSACPGMETDLGIFLNG